MAPELNHVYLGDCLEVMKTFPDKCVDLIITDPPYGMNFQSNMRFNKFKKIEGDSGAFPTHIFPELFRLARGGGLCLLSLGQHSRNSEAEVVHRLGQEQHDDGRPQPRVRPVVGGVRVLPDGGARV